MHEYSMPEVDRRLFELGGGFIAVWSDYVNLDDMCNRRPGSIVRCDRNPEECIRVFHGNPPLGVVAGWISEDD